MTRRSLLRILAAIGASVLALLLFWRPGRVARAVSRALRPRLDPASPTGALLDAETDSLVAFGEVLVEGRALSEAGRRHLIEHISDRTRHSPGYLSLYRRTAELLDGLAGARFSALELHRRTDIVTRHRLASRDVRTRDYLIPVRRQELAVRVLAVPDLIAGYYRSPAGWAVVGYDAFPGRCGSLARYTGPEG